MAKSRYLASSAFLLPLFLVFFTILLPPASLSSVFTCEFKTSCFANETGLLRAKNYSDGYNNAHAQLMNHSGDAYPYTLCCATDASHTLNNSCAHANATVVLRLNATTDSHVQTPTTGGTPYAYQACMALSPGNITCEYVTTGCSANHTGTLSLASSESDNTTNAHIANFSYYGLDVCCKVGNAPPAVPVLLYPTQGNDSVFERNVTFDWEDSADPDGDPVTYEFNLTETTCSDYNATGLASSTYLPSQELCIDRMYWWSVRACDPYHCSSWASSWNFTIASVAGITFLVNNTDFGSLTRNATDDTTDNAPPPFTIENTGNVPLNVTFKANDPLFDISGLGNGTFQYKARAFESGAYTSAQTDWANVSASYTLLFTHLNYSDAADAAYIDIRVSLPYEESAGYKSSVVEVFGNYTG